MDRKEFWKLIVRSKTYKENHVQWLIETLSKGTLEDLLSFEWHFQQVHDQSYQSDLWGAAYILMGGCSDDSFDYFRAWLISHGESVYTKVLANPDVMAAIIPKSFEEEGLIPECEDFLDIGINAFSLMRTGNLQLDTQLENEFYDLLDSRGYQSQRPDINLDWDDEQDLDERFPKLWKRFGDNPLG